MIINAFNASSQMHQINSTEELFTYWKKQYSNEALKSFTFTQKTIRFKDGKPQDTSIWYEAIQYPDLFRIDFGSKEKANINLCRNDSLYALRDGEIVFAGEEIQEFLIEGGLYFLQIEESLRKLKARGIDVSKFHETKYEGRPTYVIGTAKKDRSAPQIWFDKERRYVVWRLSKLKKGSIMEVRYDDFKKINGYWIESTVDFLIDGEMVQKEKYKNIDTNPELVPEIFKRTSFMDYYWH